MYSTLYNVYDYISVYTCTCKIMFVNLSLYWRFYNTVTTMYMYMSVVFLIHVHVYVYLCLFL